jgi:hypothetical protein
VKSFVDAGTNVTYSVPNNSLNNLKRGLVERIFLVKGMTEPPQPKPGIWESKLRKFRTKVLCHAPPTAEMSMDEFIDSRPSRKRRVYINARKDLMIKGVCREDAKLDTFIKAEKMNLSDKPDPVPRLINPRSPRYNIELGVFIKPAEHAIYYAIDSFMGARTVAKGRNAYERAQMLREAWESFDCPVALGVDASRFDQHVSKGALEYEHSFYLKLHQNNCRLRQLLGWQLHNRGYAKCKTGGIKFKVEGLRASGDMNTALGNVILMCAMLKGFCDEYKFKARIIDDGDDAVVIVEKYEEQRFYAYCKRYFRMFGFTLKYESSAYEFERIEFCQSQPIYDGERWVMCRDPRLVLAKDLICVRGFNSERQWRQLMGSVGLCGLALAGNLPIFWKFYHIFQPGGTRELESGMDYLSRGMDVKTSEPTWEARVSFYNAFNISPDEQVAIESHYDAITSVWVELASNEKGYDMLLELEQSEEIVLEILNLSRSK